MTRFRWIAAAAALSLLGALSHSVVGAAAPPASERIGRYIVTLAPGTDADQVAAEHRRDEGARVELVYRHALQGYAATMSAQAAAQIARDGRVQAVEVDQLVYATGELPTGVDRIADPATAGVPKYLTIDGEDDVRVDVDVAVIDSGIDHAHPDLDVVAGVDCTGKNFRKVSCTDGFAGDDNGHGTHVAGTIGAIDDGRGVVGVAPGARLHAVKVLDSNGSGYMSWITAGVDWVTARAGTIEVANMSLGCACTSTALDTALSGSVAKGVVYAVAAGNSNVDLATSTYSPAGHPAVITVSALSDGDGKSGGLVPPDPDCRSGEGDDVAASFSNFDSSGALIDIAAPGVCIRSTVPAGGYAEYSGTSMASPHVAGAAALLASVSKPTTADAVAAIRSTLVGTGNDGWTDKDLVEEPLLDVTDVVFTPTTVSAAAPVDGGGSGEAVSASFAYSCSQLTCEFDASGSTVASSYGWTFGDGVAGEGETTSHTYGAGGTYTVTLTVTGDGGTDMAEQSITLKAKGGGKPR